jgi:hypothetical protein
MENIKFLNLKNRLIFLNLNKNSTLNIDLELISFVLKQIRVRITETRLFHNSICRLPQ